MRYDQEDKLAVGLHPIGPILHPRVKLHQNKHLRLQLNPDFSHHLRRNKDKLGQHVPFHGTLWNIIAKLPVHFPLSFILFCFPQTAVGNECIV